mgnify:CR=1 FL=1
MLEPGCVARAIYCPPLSPVRMPAGVVHIGNNTYWSMRTGSILVRPEADTFEMHVSDWTPFVQKSPADAHQKERHCRTTADADLGSIESTFVAVADTLRDATSIAGVQRPPPLEAARAKAKKHPARPPERTCSQPLSSLTEHQCARVSIRTRCLQGLHIQAPMDTRSEPLCECAANGDRAIGLYNLWYLNAQLPRKGAAQFMMRHFDGGAFPFRSAHASSRRLGSWRYSSPTRQVNATGPQP